jgi:hypothetical protein
LFWQVYKLSQTQQKVFEEENPDVDGSQNWLAKSSSVMTSASELSSSQVEITSTSASDGDAPTPAKTKAKKTAELSAKVKKVQPTNSGSESDAALRKENKKLQVKTKKAEATADNLKKKMKQDKQALQVYINQVRDATAENGRLKGLLVETKAMQDKIKDLELALRAHDADAQPSSAALSPLPKGTGAPKAGEELEPAPEQAPAPEPTTQP